MVHLEEVGPGFWNIRGHFKLFVGIIDIGTHMSVARLANGKYLVIDTIPLLPEIKQELDQLTSFGSNIEAVVATHPFHTLAFRGFYKEYPNVPYYGTPRHLRVIPEIPWAGNLWDCDTRNKWNPDIQMRIPAGAEFVGSFAREDEPFHLRFHLSPCEPGAACRRHHHGWGPSRLPAQACGLSPRGHGLPSIH